MTDEKPSQVNGQSSPAKQRQLTMDAVTHWMYERIAVHTKGLFVYSQTLPPEIQLEAIAAAMGRVMSEATQTNAPAVTIAVRAKCAKAFEQELKTYVSALSTTLPGAPGIISPN
jgi:hypothetical protein